MAFNKRKKTIRKYIVSILLIIAVILLSNYYQKGIRFFFYSASAPFQRIFWKIGKSSSNSLQSFLNTNNLKNTNIELERKNNELLSKISSFNEIKNENDFLRKALDLGLQKEFSLILSQVISKDISQDFILINKGSRDGIKENMPAISEQKIILGKTSEVYENFSKIELIFNKNVSFDAKIHEKNISGLIKGQGRGELILDLIPREKEVAKNDLISTTNLGGVFPAGMLVGKVKNVNKNDVEAFLQITVEPAFNISDLSNIFIIR